MDKSSGSSVDPARTAPGPAVAVAEADFAQALGEAMARRGLGLERIRYHLATRGFEVSVATLSYWRSGRSRPERASSIAAVGALEEVLGVPRGRLASLLRPLGGPAGAALKRLIEDRPTPASGDSTLDSLLGELGLSWEDHVNRISLQEEITLNTSGWPARHRVREIVQSRVDGVASFPIWYDIGEGTALASVRALRGINVSRQLARGAMTVAEMSFPAPLRVGECALVEYDLCAEGDVPDMTSWSRTCLVYHREVYTQITFPRGLEPRDCYQFTVVDDVQESTPATLTAGGLRHARAGFGPGVYGLGWEWCTPPS